MIFFKSGFEKFEAVLPRVKEKILMTVRASSRLKHHPETSIRIFYVLLFEGVFFCLFPELSDLHQYLCDLLFRKYELRFRNSLFVFCRDGNVVS